VLYNGTGYGTYNSSIPLVSGGVFNKEWWDIHLIAGAATAKVSLKWDDARKTLNHTSPGTLVVAHFTGGAWQSEGGSSGDAAGSSTGTTGPSNAVASFSPFTFGSTDVPLPILISSFTATEKDCQVYLEWTTALEENADGFEIQQSTDGVRYATVAFVKAKGTPSDYQISVPQSVQQAFYRIRQEDLDGAFTYSAVVRVQLGCILREDNLAVYPNPVFAALNIEARYFTPADRGAAQILLVDMSGKPVYSHIIAVNKGANVYSIPSMGLGKGIYMLFLIGEGWKTGGVKVLISE
jgi:hypothetical protein